MVALPMGCPIGKVDSWPMWRVIKMSVEFIEVEQIEVDLLPVEQISTITFKAIHWALKTRKTIWVL